ncbi:MAG: cytochrome c biogenesis protein ResB [Deltaproteobacteria bacterium]|nr:cytochrome c biogenesis protein ResB [Deltaproteobacteria bacterium]
MSKKCNAFWTFFSSVKLTVALFIAIAFASVLGTFIPQQEAAETLTGRISPGVIQLLRTLQLSNIFHSLWFTILLALLCLNLFVCSLNRFPAAFRQFSRSRSSAKPDAPNHPEPDKQFAAKNPLPITAALLSTILQKRFGHIEHTTEGSRHLLYAEKGRFSYFGPYIVHVGILIILGGAIAGFLLGFEGYTELGEGESTDTVYMKGSKAAKKLPFTIRCDRFSLEFYDDGTPKRYRSDISFLRGERLLSQGNILVNHPLQFEGFRFYQANYGIIPDSRMTMTVRRHDEKVAEQTIEEGSEFDLPGVKAGVRILRLESNFMNLGPAAKVYISSPGEDLQFWVFQDIDRIVQENPGLLMQMPIMDPGLFKPYVFSLAPAGSRYFTGLMVNRDPSLPIVITGALIMVLGLLGVFFYDHRRVWISLEDRGEGTEVSLAGRCNRNIAGLNRELDFLTEKIESPVESPK